ncbi:MAG: hypothetical protein M3Z95_05420 [Actinomycetota bacterium]|nr:hypothetical protein [Actinomycetota bacterium]
MSIAQSDSAPICDRRAAKVGRLSLALGLAILMLTAPGARGDTGATIINKCTHGESLIGFSQQDYSRALQELPTEVEEYSDCANLIRRAQLAAAGGAGAGAVVSAIPLTAGERAALTRVPKSGPSALRVGGQVIRPGVVHASIASAVSSLPTPLLAILAFLLAGALWLAGRAIRNRVRADSSS